MGTLHYGFSPYWQQGLTYLLPLTESDQMLPARYSKMTLMSNFCKDFFLYGEVLGGFNPIGNRV